MSRPLSRLSTLLRVRRIQEEISRGQLAAEAAAERGARGTLEEARARYAAPVADSLQGTKTAECFISERRYSGALAGAVCAAGVSVEAAAYVTAQARADWSAAALRVAALERLEDRAREAARTELLAAEQRTSEESASAQRQRGPADSTTGIRR
jgi:flagellar biosynthesis chaperone FliJ